MSNTDSSNSHKNNSNAETNYMKLPQARKLLTTYSKLLLIDTAKVFGCNIQITDSDSKYIKVLVSVNGNPQVYNYIRMEVCANSDTSTDYNINTKHFGNFAKLCSDLHTVRNNTSK